MFVMFVLGDLQTSAIAQLETRSRRYMIRFEDSLVFMRGFRALLAAPESNL